MWSLGRNTTFLMTREKTKLICSKHKHNLGKIGESEEVGSQVQYRKGTTLMLPNWLILFSSEEELEESLSLLSRR